MPPTIPPLPLDDFMARDKDPVAARRHHAGGLDFGANMKASIGLTPWPAMLTCSTIAKTYWPRPKSSRPRLRKNCWPVAGEIDPRPIRDFYGVRSVRAKGSAVARIIWPGVQQFGGSILDKDGKTKLNTPENVKILEHFGSLFKVRPPGSTRLLVGSTRNRRFVPVK